MTDYRIVWLQDRISKALGVQQHPETIEVLFKEHYEKFQAFLDDVVDDVCDMEKCILYIYRTFYDRLVEREVLTIEKGIVFLYLFIFSLPISLSLVHSVLVNVTMDKVSNIILTF
jgi:hypothetical protein